MRLDHDWANVIDSGPEFVHKPYPCLIRDTIEYKNAELPTLVSHVDIPSKREVIWANFFNPFCGVIFDSVWCRKAFCCDVLDHQQDVFCIIQLRGHLDIRYQLEA
jgi:hypothetical protein